MTAADMIFRRTQIQISLPFPAFRSRQVRPADMIWTEVYDRDDGSMLIDPGFFLDHAPRHFNVFKLQAV